MYVVLILVDTCSDSKSHGNIIVVFDMYEHIIYVYLNKNRSYITFTIWNILITLFYQFYYTLVYYCSRFDCTLIFYIR